MEHTMTGVQTMMMPQLEPGDARVGDVVTPNRPITQSGGDPKFTPGERLSVVRAEAHIVTVEDAQGNQGTWSCSVFQFLEPKSQTQQLSEATLDILAALSTLRVAGHSIRLLDTKLDAAMSRAERILSEKGSADSPRPPSTLG
jgi:hypothetical protein